MTTNTEKLEALRQECFVKQRELNEERAKLEDQQYRVKNAEASLSNTLKEWQTLQVAV